MSDGDTQAARQPQPGSQKTRAENIKGLGQERATFYKIVFFGLSAASVASVVQAMSMERPDTPILVAMFCFAISIPLTVTGGIIGTTNIDLDQFCFQRGESPPAFIAPFVRAGRLFAFLGGAGMLLSIAGLGAIFWHFSAMHGIMFAIITCTTLFTAPYFVEQTTTSTFRTKIKAWRAEHPLANREE